MDLGLKDRVALVTASSKGMGKAIALGLAEEGARIAMCARDAGALEASADEVRRQTGVEVLAMPADMSRAEDVTRLVEATLSRFGRIDVLLCNAGGPPAGQFHDFPDDGPWQKAFEQNLMSVVRLCRLVIPSMREHGWGRIATITSTSVKEPLPHLALSNVMRAGVTALVKTLATELGPHGILVNNVLPHAVLTDRTLSLTERDARATGKSVEELFKESAQNIPVRHIASPAEFAQLVLFLLSERNTYVTGATIPIDGGAIHSLM